MLKIRLPQTESAQFLRGNNPIQFTEETDIAITESVDRLLRNDDVLRGTDYHEFDIYTNAQVVHVRGHVMDSANQQRIENAVCSVPGVLGIQNALVLDDDLERKVTDGLKKFEDQASVKFSTGVRYGVVTLDGEVGDVNLRASAEKCAASVPGVRGVLNEIHLSGGNRETEANRFIQPSIGEQFYLRDGPSGVVQQVIMNPNNRLVIAIVIQENPPERETASGVSKAEDLAPAKKLVVSTREIRYLSHHAYPQLQRDAPEPYKDFEPSNFIAPNKNWIPPYPYTLGDVLFPAD